MGWATVASGANALPKFDGVSGVSTGAFIAPFAFLGTHDDYETIDRLFRNPKPDWAERRGPFFFLPENASLADIRGLVRELRAQIDLKFAKESRKLAPMVSACCLFRPPTSIAAPLAPSMPWPPRAKRSRRAIQTF